MMTKSLQYKFGLVLLLTAVVVSSWAKGTVREFFVYDASNGMAANGAQTIKCTKTGRMVISTIGHVNFFDGHHFSHIVPMQTDIYPLPGYSGNYRLMFDLHHHLWLKDKEQVICVDLTTEKVDHNPSKTFSEIGFTKPVVDLFTDSGNRIWGVSENKLYSPDHERTFPVLKSADLHDVDVYNEQYVLLFYSDGLTKIFDLADSYDETEVQAPLDHPFATSVILNHGQGFFQIGNFEKGGAVLQYLDMNTRQWKKILSVPYRLNNMAVHKDCLYIACSLGYWIYDIKTGEAVHVKELQLSKGKKLSTDINVIEFDRQGGMWLGTETRGLLYAKPFYSPFYTYTWNQPEAVSYFKLMSEKVNKTPVTYHHHVNGEFTDSRGWKWTATYTGLKLQRHHKGKGKIYGRRDGLMSEMVHAVVEDRKHDIWVSTSYGISHLYIKGDSVNRIETYIEQDNVPTEAFINGMAALLDDGNIVMQALDHMVVFNPDSIHELDSDDYIIYPKLVELRVNGQDVEVGKKYYGHMITDRAVTRTKVIHLNYDQNTILLTFSGMNYFRPMQTYYRIRVKGTRHYNNWHMLSHEKTPDLVDKYGMLRLLLTNLTPGDYHVEVQTALVPDADNWEQEVYEWGIVVHEPWWRSTGIYLTLLLFLFILLIVNLFFFNKNTRLRMMRNNEEYDMMNRFKNFAIRCENMSQEVLSPNYLQEYDLGELSNDGQMSHDFMKAMLIVIPYLREKENMDDVSISDIAKLMGISTSEFYDLMAANLDKNPRKLLGWLRLNDAKELLRDTDKSVDEISDECHFISPNYFIAAFYHRYRMTPDAYRKSSAL